MGNIDEQILRAAKEIVVKFIEAGRISPSGFHETFKDIYRTIEKTTQASIKPAHEGSLAKPEPKEVLEKKRKKNK
jgi:hypothetical protein